MERRDIRRAPEAAQTQPPLLNWAGNYRYGTNRITSATSVAQVQEFVRKHDRFKVLGTRHCFNGIADSADAFLSLCDMAKMVELDPVARTVTAESGISYGQLCPHLDQQGFALTSPHCRTSLWPVPVLPPRTVRVTNGPVVGRFRARDGATGWRHPANPAIRIQEFSLCRGHLGGSASSQGGAGWQPALQCGRTCIWTRHSAAESFGHARRVTA